MNDSKSKKYNCYDCRYRKDGGFVCDVCIARIIDELHIGKRGKDNAQKTDRGTKATKNDTGTI